MSWAKYLTLFSLSTVKFMFAPLGGIAMELTFIETYLSCVAGAASASAFFFYLSDYFMSRHERRKREKERKAIASGKPYKPKKKFSFTNKLIVKTKFTFGIYGICLWVPLFFSIPLGSVIVAKFYRKDKRSFPLVLTGIFLNGFITSSIVYIKAFF